MKRAKAGGIETASLILALAILVMVFPSAFAVQPDKPTSEAITPNPTIQSALSALVLANAQQPSASSEESLRERFEQLRKMAGQDKDFVLQLLYFNAHAKNETEYWLPWVIVEKLGISNDIFAEVGIGMLNTADAATRKLAFNCLTRADNNPEGGVIFSRYEKILREQKQDSAQGLIRYMYWRDPQAAVLAMSRVYGGTDDEARIVTQLKGDPKAVLVSLADGPNWWAHLYVAETMKKQPQLRDAAILKKLEKDDNVLIKEKVAEITSGK